MYEGSLFYGTRFNDSKIVDDLLTRMSSGECLLVSLLHFIYNAIVRRALPQDKPIIMLIDEIELALHPIAVVRLLDLLRELIEQHHNLVVILSSHSPEVIRTIQPNNLFQIELSKREEGLVEVNTPCYPSYAIRDVYMHDGFDIVVLVEDYLAKNIVQTIIDEKDISRSKLINILPVGGWSNVLNLQHELYIHSTFGAGTKIFSILDDDIQKAVGQQYKEYPKLFIPIGSIEKFLKKVLITEVDTQIKKEVNDKFFYVRSIDNLISEYIKTNKKKDEDGKELYKIIRADFEKRSIAEMTFVEGICKIAKKYIDFSRFETNLENFLKNE
ncbi:MAG: AAA family ATPase [Clostridium sp.]|nr:AAA family ATPase [Clostridium sp.]